MKCKNCNADIKYPFSHCIICGEKIKWSKKDITKELIGRIILSAVVAVITTACFKLFGK